MAANGTLKIQVAPSVVLSATAQDISFPLDEDIRQIAESMARTMYATSGCGIAAPQIGLSKRLIVIDCQYMDSGQREPVFMFNPVIEELDGEIEEDYEGCLSVPGISLLVPRNSFAKVSYTDIDGNHVLIAGEGLMARCLQHEVDHLDGKTMLDAVKGFRKVKALSSYQSALKQGALPGDAPLFAVK